MQSIFLAMRWIFWPSLGGSSRSSLLQWLEMFSPFFLCWCYVLPSLNGGGVAFEVIWNQNEIITLASGLWKISCSLCTDIPGFLGFLLKDRSLLALISFRWCDLVWLLGGSRSAWGSAPLPQQQLYRLSEITGSNVFRALQVALPSWAIAVPGARPCAGLCIIFTKTLAAGVIVHAPARTFIPGLPARFYIVFCPIPGATQRLWLVQTHWHCKLQTSKLRSDLICMRSLGFHGGWGNLFTVGSA